MRLQFILSRVTLISWMVISLAGCAAGSSAAVQVQRVSSTRYASTNQVQMITGPLEPGDQLVAHLRIEGAANQTRAQLVAMLLQKAGALGANALNISSERQRALANTGPASFNPAGGNYVYKAPIRAWTIEAGAYRIQR